MRPSGGSEQPDARYFSCTYANNGPGAPKRKKTYFDGFLSVAGANITLLSLANKSLGSTPFKSPHQLVEDENIDVGTWIVCVGPPQNKSGIQFEFTSGNKKAKTNDDDDNDTSSIQSLKVPIKPIGTGTVRQPMKPLIPASNAAAVNKPFRPPQMTAKAALPSTSSTASTVHRPPVSSIPPPAPINCPSRSAIQNVPGIPHVNTTMAPPPTSVPSTVQSTNSTLTTSAPAGALLLCRSPLIYVSPDLTQHLRPHQRQGVHFLFKCILGQKVAQSFGSILCDDVGLGKSLQTIALIDAITSASQRTKFHPYLHNRAMIVCPATLLRNWQQEIKKWVGSFKFNVSLVQSDTPTSNIAAFLSSSMPSIMIISYESCRKFGQQIQNFRGILICDEAHRLKSKSDNKTIQTLKSFTTQQRILLTATPVQNNLGEFYAMADFASPGCLGAYNTFKTNYMQPILAAQESSNIDKVAIQLRGQAQCDQLTQLISKFVLRRSHATIMKHLPPKTECTIFLTPTPLQIALTKSVLQYYKSHRGDILPTLNVLRKIATTGRLVHGPSLSQFGLKGGDTSIPSSSSSSSSSNKPTRTDDDDDDDDDNGKGGDMSTLLNHLKQTVFSSYNTQPSSNNNPIDQWSSKLSTLKQIVSYCIPYTNILIISSYTETLTAVDHALKPYTCLRLDGTVPVKQRDSIIQTFNRPVPKPVSQSNNNTTTTNNKPPTLWSLFDTPDDSFGPSTTTNRNPNGHTILLLSAKAAGAGLNLINGCVTICCDCNWNPAIDIQAQGRMWRSGQTQHVYIFRLVTNGTIDERILQRQVAKQDVATSILSVQSVSSNTTSGAGAGNSKKEVLNKLTPDELKRILDFEYMSPKTYAMLKEQEQKQSITSQLVSKQQRKAIPPRKAIKYFDASSSSDSDSSSDDDSSSDSDDSLRTKVEPGTKSDQRPSLRVITNGVTLSNTVEQLRGGFTCYPSTQIDAFKQDTSISTNITGNQHNMDTMITNTGVFYMIVQEFNTKNKTNVDINDDDADNEIGLTACPPSALPSSSQDDVEDDDEHNNESYNNNDDDDDDNAQNVPPNDAPKSTLSFSSSSASKSNSAQSSLLSAFEASSSDSD